MIKKSTFSILFLKIVAFVICFNINSAFADDFNSWFEELSDKEKIGQLFVTGITSKKLTKEEINLIREWQIGGVILFKRNHQNTAQFKSLNKSLSKILSKNNLEPFLFVDQEGGNVVRIGSRYDFPSMYSLGQINNSKVTHTVGESIGRLLLDNNISVNLAPVADLRDSFSYNFISNRSFGDNEDRVSNMVLEYSKGLYNNGVIPTLKHFPGLGNVVADSHRVTALKRTSLKELRKKDLLPYMKLSKEKIPFLTMTSHTRLVLDGDDYGVTTYSKKALSILREISDKNQVIITDDMEMEGAGDQGRNFDNLALDSFKAGHDLILIGWSKRKLTKSLYSFLAEYRTNDEFKLKVKSSLERIYSLKNNSQIIRRQYVDKIIPTRKILNASANLNNKIANYFLSKKFKAQERGLAQDEKAIAKKDNLIFFSSDRQFKKDIKFSQVYSLLLSNPKIFKSTCDQDTTCVLHVSGMKTAKMAKKIVQNNKNVDFLIVNSTDPLLTKYNSSRVEVVNTFTQPKDLGSLVENIFIKNLKVAHTQ